MNYDIIIIGAGPAGYVAAIRAGQLGMRTALLEKKEVGGMCLNWGCIPTKSLIESAKFYHRVKLGERMGVDGIDPKKLRFNWNQATNRAGGIVKKLTTGVNYLLKKNGVEVIHGEARITSPTTISIDNRSLETAHILIATGSYPAPLPSQFHNKRVVGVEQLLALKDIPARVAVYGNGGSALELAQFFSMIDREVTLISPPGELLPGFDPYLANYMITRIKSQGIRLTGSDEESDFELLINCSSRHGVVPPNDLNISIDNQNFIQVDDSLQSSVRGIYAAGDVNGRSNLAHVASAQGIFVVNKIKGLPGRMDIRRFPLNLYSDPEMAQIGLTEEEIRQKGLEYRIGEFPMSANGKALAEEAGEGIVRILSEKKFGEVLGVQIIAANATDLIAEASAYMSVEATVYDIARTVHAHPTISEVFMEAGMEAADKAIHK